MLLNVRSVAVSIAVMCFFGMAIVGLFSGLSPFICCKRAILGALLAYITGTCVIKAINAILLNAMITNRMKSSRKMRSQQKEMNIGSKD